MWREGCDLLSEMHYYERERKLVMAEDATHEEALREGVIRRERLAATSGRCLGQLCRYEGRRPETLSGVLLERESEVLRLGGNGYHAHGTPADLGSRNLYCERLRLQGSRSRSTLALQFYV